MIDPLRNAARTTAHVAMHVAVQAALLLAFGIPAHATQKDAPANTSAHGKYIERGRCLVKVGYRFVRHLGPAGKPAPAALAPGVAPKGPAILFPTPPAR